MSEKISTFQETYYDVLWQLICNNNEDDLEDLIEKYPDAFSLILQQKDMIEKAAKIFSQSNELPIANAKANTDYLRKIQSMTLPENIINISKTFYKENEILGDINELNQSLRTKLRQYDWTEQLTRQDLKKDPIQFKIRIEAIVIDILKETHLKNKVKKTELKQTPKTNQNHKPEDDGRSRKSSLTANKPPFAQK